MSPLINLGRSSPQEEPKKNPVAPEAPVSKSSQPLEEQSKPTVVMTNVDSYIHEVIASQPSSVEEAVSHVVSLSEEVGLHRLSLPEYFEKMSYDCTRGNLCKDHVKEEVILPTGSKTFKVSNPGKYVFRWVLKDKRAIDTARNVRGWSIVSRLMSGFRDAPRVLFNANGAVEIGDDILAVMPVERALRLRRFPGDLSRERLRGQITPSKKAGKVLMTGNPDSDHVYEPASIAGQEGEEEVSGAPEGGIEFREGRDF